MTDLVLQAALDTQGAELVRHLRSLHDLLEEEGQILRQRELAELGKTIERKQGILSQIEQLARGLTALLAAHGGGKDSVAQGKSAQGKSANSRSAQGRSVFTVCIEALDRTPKWDEIKQLLKQCEQSNRINGAMIGASQTFNDTLLQQLHGGSSRLDSLYGASGRLTFDSGTRSNAITIAKA